MPTQDGIEEAGGSLKEGQILVFSTDAGVKSYKLVHEVEVKSRKGLFSRKPVESNIVHVQPLHELGGKVLLGMYSEVLLPDEFFDDVIDADVAKEIVNQSGSSERR